MNAIIGCRLGLSSFDPALFCAAPMPNQKGRLTIDGNLATQKGLRSGSEGALRGPLDRSVLLKTYPDMLRRTCGSMKQCRF